MKIKALFYDFDGVIKESTGIKTDAFYDLYLPFGKDIAKKAAMHHIEHGGVSRFEKIKLYHQSFLNIRLTAEEINELAQKFSDLVFNKVLECPYVAGSHKAINQLKDRYDQYVITGTPQNEIELIVKRLSIDSCFKSVHGSPKTKTELCQLVLDKSGLKPEEVAFVGDATTDYDAARELNLKFILREHDENIRLFADKEVLKIHDLTFLEKALQKMEL